MEKSPPTARKTKSHSRACDGKRHEGRIEGRAGYALYLKLATQDLVRFVSCNFVYDVVYKNTSYQMVNENVYFASDQPKS